MKIKILCCNVVTYMMILKMTRMQRMKKIQIMRTRRISTFSMNKTLTVGSRTESSTNSSIIFLSAVSLVLPHSQTSSYWLGGGGWWTVVGGSG